MGQNSSKKQEIGRTDFYGVREYVDNSTFANNGLLTNNYEYRSTNNNALYRTCNTCAGTISYDKFVELRYDPVNDPERVIIGRRASLYLLPMGNGIAETIKSSSNSSRNHEETTTASTTTTTTTTTSTIETKETRETRETRERKDSRIYQNGSLCVSSIENKEEEWIQRRMRDKERKTIDGAVCISNYILQNPPEGKLEDNSTSIQTGNEFTRRLGILLHTKGHRFTGNSSTMVYDYLRYDEQNKRYVRKRKHKLFSGLRRSSKYPDAQENETHAYAENTNRAPISSSNHQLTSQSQSQSSPPQPTSLVPTSSNISSPGGRTSILSTFSLPSANQNNEKDKNALLLGPAEASSALRPGDQIYAINGTVVLMKSRKNILKMITNVLEETSLPLIIIFKKYEMVNSIPFEHETPLPPPKGIPYCPQNEYSLTLYGTMPPVNSISSSPSDSTKNVEEAKQVRKEGKGQISGVMGGNKLSSVSI